jgi:hypothetical protein
MAAWPVARALSALHDRRWRRGGHPGLRRFDARPTWPAADPAHHMTDFVRQYSACFIFQLNVRTGMQCVADDKDD